ncbi:hypothetical protein [Runella sp. SP2]|uniref:hypothetical protein n=1 Tax=Runella sp. SP2 TaxID=2268026 RepID=UPI000F080B5F|nr:hypothetical protein [Runella sp. SP2]AYQ30868.1 hypothetical protein DTQ70_01145 [Runella sp. SP2]
MLKKEKLKIIRQWYPNAITTIDSVNRFIDFIEEHLNLEPEQVMLADSVCSDDVNSIQYPARTKELLGPFKMGGLDGFPFTGLTGMGAFASHVPDNGAVFIYYGPHIGITKTGTIGEIHRFGQHKNSGCCGAAKGALAKLMTNQIVEGNITELDYQMNMLEQILLKQKERILSAQTPLYEATEVIYEAIDARICELVSKTTYNCKYVILMGAVLINSDTDMGSYTSAKRFELIDLESGQKRDLMELLTV